MLLIHATKRFQRADMHKRNITINPELPRLHQQFIISVTLCVTVTYKCEFTTSVFHFVTLRSAQYYGCYSSYQGQE